MTLVIAFNLEILFRLFYHLRKTLVENMVSGSGTWKEMGEELRESSPYRTTRSDWWLMAYLLPPLRKVVGRGSKEDDQESKQTGREGNGGNATSGGSGGGGK